MGIVVEEGGVFGVGEALGEEFRGEGEGFSVVPRDVIDFGVVLFVSEGGLGIGVSQGFAEVVFCGVEVVVGKGLELGLVFGSEGVVVVLALGAGLGYIEGSGKIETFGEKSEISAVFGGEAQECGERGGGFEGFFDLVFGEGFGGVDEGGVGEGGSGAVHHDL